MASRRATASTLSFAQASMSEAGSLEVPSLPSTRTAWVRSARACRGRLATLGEFAEGGWSDAPLEDVRSHLERETWLPPWRFSLGAQHLPGECVLPHELSLTMRPAFADALVLGVGEAARRRWSLLTGEDVSAAGGLSPGTVASLADGIPTTLERARPSGSEFLGFFSRVSGA